MNNPSTGATSRALNFVNDYYPNAVAALLCGSTAEGTATHSSDVDIIVFVSERTAITAFRHLNLGQEIDVITISIANFKNFIIKEINNLVAAQLRMIITAQVLFDHHGIVENIKRVSRYYFFKGPPSLRNSNIATSLFMVEKACSSLKSSRSKLESTFLFFQLCDEMIKLLLDYHGSWSAENKWKARHLRSIALDICVEWEIVADAFWHTGDTEMVSSFAKKIMTQWKAPEVYSTSITNPHIWLNGAITVNIPLVSSESYHLWIENFLFPLCSKAQFPEKSFYFFLRNDINFQYPEAILSLTSLGKIKPQEFDTLIQDLYKNMDHEASQNMFRSPVFSSTPIPPLRFGGREAFYNAESILRSASFNVLSNDVRKNSPLNFAIYLLIGIAKGLGLQLAEFYEFSKQATIHAGMLAVNLDVFDDYLKIRTIPDSLAKEFHKNFQVDESTLSAALKPLFDSWGDFEIEETWFNTWQLEVKSFWIKFSAIDDQDELSTYIPGIVNVVSRKQECLLYVIESIFNVAGLNTAEIPYVFFLTEKLCEQSLTFDGQI